MSTSFSDASCTEQMGFSVLGLIVSNVLPSTDLTNSPPMKLEQRQYRTEEGRGNSGEVYLQTGGLLVLLAIGQGDGFGERHCE